MSSLDPIFPLPAGTGIPPIKQGRGKDLFENDLHVPAGLTYRAFYVIWEQVEQRAAHNYPKYVDGPLNKVAQTWLEAVVWCREIGHPLLGELTPISEKEARKIRAKEEKRAKQEAAAKRGKSRTPVVKGDNDAREGELSTPTTCPKCGPNRTVLKKKFKGEKVWKCVDCGHRWPRSAPEASTGSSKARKRASGSKAPGNKEPRPQKSKRRGSKRT